MRVGYQLPLCFPTIKDQDPNFFELISSKKIEIYIGSMYILSRILAVREMKTLLNFRKSTEVFLIYQVVKVKHDLVTKECHIFI